MDLVSLDVEGQETEFGQTQGIESEGWDHPVGLDLVHSGVVGISSLYPNETAVAKCTVEQVNVLDLTVLGGDVEVQAIGFEGVNDLEISSQEAGIHALTCPGSNTNIPIFDVLEPFRFVRCFPIHFGSIPCS